MHIISKHGHTFFKEGTWIFIINKCDTTYSNTIDKISNNNKYLQTKNLGKNKKNSEHNLKISYNYRV